MHHLFLPFLLPFVLLLFASQAAAFVEDDLLKPEEAFRLEARALDSQTIEASWDIERGYYLYRERFKFTTDSDSVVLGTADFPPGKIKEDEFFGKMET